MEQNVIEIKSKAFAIRIIRMYKWLTENKREMYNSIYPECVELAKLLTSIIKTTKANNKL